MPKLGFFRGRTPGASLGRILWPAGVLFGTTLWIIFSTILWTIEKVNDLALDRQHALFAMAIDRRLDDLRTHLADWIISAEARAIASGSGADRLRIGGQQEITREFDVILTISPDGVLSTIWTETDVARSMTPAELWALAAPVVGKAQQSADQAVLTAGSPVRPVAALLHTKSVTYAALAFGTSTLAPSGMETSNTSMLVALKWFKDSEWSRIAQAQALHDVRLEGTTTHSRAALPLLDSGGRVGTYLTWKPSRPGDLLRDWLVPFMLTGFVLAVVLFAMLATYLHQLVTNLDRTERRSRELIGLDHLSGLANRMRFGEALDRALDHVGDPDGHLAVLFVDLDRFKDVNDTYGHRAGDELIQLVARRLLDLLQSPDTLARFGGDEFAIIQKGVRTSADAGALAYRILNALAEPFALSDSQIIVGASIGIALAPDHAVTREALMGLADTALYQAKAEGRNRYVFFQSRMDETIRMRKIVEEDLRQTIADDGLNLLYQPLFAADGTTIVAVEALVRWPHPTHGLISPVEFIPIAEERGLVIPLGDWVLRRACRDGLRWPGIRVAVNVSPMQFRHRDFVDKVTGVIAETGFDPARLELELTEGVVVDDADAAETAMIDLRALGIHLALDDFGTGYSSLIYLRRFPFDTIKIDRSFLESMEAEGESAILVQSMVHLGRALGLTVTAEGVESAEQHRFLQALGCHQLQGYLFSRPVTAAEIDRMLADGTSVSRADAA